MKDKISYKCINCDSAVNELYKIYSATVSKLTTCDNCQQIADKYIEYEPVIIMIDLVLLRKEAFRHFLFNTEFQVFWKIAILIQLMEAYSEWMFTFPKNLYRDIEDMDNDNIPLKLNEMEFYSICLKVLFRNLIYISSIYGLTSYLMKLKIVSNPIDLITIIKTFTISSFGKFFLLPALIWSDYMSENLNIMFVLIYTTLCQFLVYSVVCRCSMIWSIIVVVNSNILRILSTDLIKSFYEYLSF